MKNKFKVNIKEENNKRAIRERNQMEIKIVQIKNDVDLKIKSY
jgi:hypothetical protein